MEPTRLEAIRAYLEQTDPWLYDYTRERAEADYNAQWKLLLEVERLREVLSTIAAAQPEKLDFWDLRIIAEEALDGTEGTAR